MLFALAAMDSSCRQHFSTEHSLCFALKTHNVDRFLMKIAHDLFLRIAMEIRVLRCEQAQDHNPFSHSEKCGPRAAQGSLHVIWVLI